MKRLNVSPLSSPAFSSAFFVALSVPKIATPGASDALMPCASAALSVLIAVGESRSSVYAFAEPDSRPPRRRFGRCTSSVRGENREPSGIVTVSAPHR